MKLEPGDHFQDIYGEVFRVLTRAVDPDTFAFVYQAEHTCTHLAHTVDERNIVKCVSRAPYVSALETPARVLPLPDYMAELAAQQLDMFTTEFSRNTEGWPFEIIDDWTRRVLNQLFTEERVDHYCDTGEDAELNEVTIPLRNHFIYRSLSEWIKVHPEFAQMPQIISDLLDSNSKDSRDSILKSAG